MDFAGAFGWAEWLLVIAVTAQVAAMAYLASPRWKAFVYSLPIPFSIGLFIVNRPVDASNVLGLLLLLVYIHLIRVFYIRWGWNIILSIVVSAGLYLAFGSVMNTLLPADDPTLFLWAILVTTAISVVAMRLQPSRSEPGHKTTLPVYVKLPLIMIIVSLLVAMKGVLGGFMTTFPLVGVLGAYESRHCLWTMSRQFPRLILCILALIIVLRLTGKILPMPVALLAGWCVALPLLWKISVRDHHTLDAKHLENLPESGNQEQKS
ncbi:hypothetical protein QPK87_22955 [Kamptonema cortianum]|nr:hypothetical protein [Oscillatoria laete-virens]MDK3159412.1 hypothetical protein [Kamptonema cortianum]MDL5050440.1 hypothetical protein [Oscillatoria amoena NRMC-F 0135]MDL5054163.1 hypothetical protein [Oscillatoria laete-virens NRMC-F 0139]